jgi:biotin synthase
MKPTLIEIQEIYFKPLMQLVREASSVHSQFFREGEIQASSLLSIKTGGCPENCSYCPQSAHNKTGIEKQALLEKSQVVQHAQKAQALGASRFCMGAAWREVKDGPSFDHVLDLVSAVRALGLEVCCTLGMLTKPQADRLKEAGLQFYNHNLDSSREFYGKVVQTRTYDDRLKTIENVRNAGIAVCTGGILGLGETHEDRMGLIQEIVGLEPVPESITINTLVPFEGTPLSKNEPVDPLDVVRVIACLRVLAPQSKIRLSAGRLSLSAETQFLCFLAGANSIFLGEKLLTSPNPEAALDLQWLDKMGAHLAPAESYART